MSTYNNILVVVDLSATSHLIIARAQAVATGTAATISLMHAVEYVPMEPMGETVLASVQLETELVARATARLAQLAADTGLNGAVQIVTVGSIKAEIQRAAEKMLCDLIVVGNHQRHGLKTLLNFTEDAVLHVAPCDVLAVHLPENSG